MFSHNNLYHKDLANISEVEFAASQKHASQTFPCHELKSITLNISVMLLNLIISENLLYSYPSQNSLYYIALVHL
jgi:hypothetical protein